MPSTRAIVCALAALAVVALSTACSRRATPRADPPGAAVDVVTAAADEPVLRPLDEPAVPPGACQRALCVAPSDAPVVPPYRAPFSRCAPVVSVADAERQPGDAPEGFFSASATRTGRRLVADACCYVVQRACDAGTGDDAQAGAHHRARR